MELEFAVSVFVNNRSTNKADKTNANSRFVRITKLALAIEFYLYVVKILFTFALWPPEFCVFKAYIKVAANTQKRTLCSK